MTRGTNDETRPPRDPERMLLFVLSLLLVLFVALMLIRLGMDAAAGHPDGFELFRLSD